MIATAKSASAQLLSSPSLASDSHYHCQDLAAASTSSTYHFREEPATKNYYEARVLLVVVFGFGLLDAIMRQGLNSATAAAAL